MYIFIIMGKKAHGKYIDVGTLMHIEYIELLKKYLESNDIPYYDGIILAYISTSFDFVIPGAVIKLKTGKFTKKRVKAIERIQDQCETLRKVIPDEMKIYVYMPNTEDTSIIDIPDCVVTSNVNDIKMSDVVYYAKKQFYINSIISTLNDNYEKDKNIMRGKLCTTEFIYNSCLPVLHEDEIARLEGMEIKKMTEEEIMNHPYVCLFGKSRKEWKLQKVKPEILDTKKKIDKCYFNNFSIKTRNTLLDTNRDNSLPNGRRKAIRHVPGITFVCDKCKRIYYLKKKFGYVCYDCN